MTLLNMKECVNANKSGHYFEHKNIVPSVLNVDPIYQRNLNQVWVKRICDHWDFDRVRTPWVSMREDGSLYIVDGQHTVAAWQIMCGPNTPILCKVYRGLTYDEEVTMFLNQAKDVHPVSKLTLLNSMYQTGDVDVNDMVRAASEAGVEVKFESGGPAFGRCVAAVALYQMWKTLSRRDFVEALQVITAAWQGQKESYAAGIIKGMTNIYKKYKGQFKPIEMRKALSKNSPNYYIREAKDMVGSEAVRYEKLFLRAYNGRKSANKLGE